MITILMYGALRRRFGKRFQIAAATPAMALHAISVQLPDFEKYLREHSSPGFHVLVDNVDHDAESLREIHSGKVVKIIPAIEGRSAGFRTILGVALIIFGSMTSWAGGAFLVKVGIGLALGGVSEMLTKRAGFVGASLNKGPEDSPSYAFQGPHMTTGQGNCVPIGYGRARVAGALVSVGISPETWPTKGFGGKATDEAGTIYGNGDGLPWVWAVAPVQG